MGHIECRSLSGVHNLYGRQWDAPGLDPGYPGAVYEYVGAQLSFSSFVRTSHQILSGNVQEYSGQEKQESEGDKERISNSKTIARERRPELGSLIAAMISLGVGFSFGVIACDRWSAKNRVSGALFFVGCILLGLDGTFGLLLSLDLWSLWRWL